MRDEGEYFVWSQKVTQTIPPDRGLLYDPFTNILITPEPLVLEQKLLGTQPAFKTSTGAELRFFMPVLNVPFRLIFAANPQRDGVLNYSTGQPEKSFRFRFDVGSTF